MNIFLKTTGIAIVVAFFVLPINESWAHDDSDHHFPVHSHNPKAHTQESVRKTKEYKEHHDSVYLSPKKIELSGIKIETLTKSRFSSEVYAPGVVKENGYKSYVVSPRTDSVVINRHAHLGDQVKVGQKLITLFSEAIAEAQADFLIASSNWDRLKKLGRDKLSEHALVEAKSIYKASYGKLIALGLTPGALDSITKQENLSFGQYVLIAERDGVVLQDDFMQGQRIEAGETIMLLADESDLWVEANVPPNKELNLALGSPALIDLNGIKYQASVIQEAHTIDPITRTRTVRLSVTNTGHKLHSGLFVKVYFQFELNSEVIAVPEEALIRSSDGDWTVFIEDHPNVFKAVEVTIGRSFGEYREVFSLESGTKVVTRGAFFVASEIAKSGFDPHNH